MYLKPNRIITSKSLIKSYSVKTPFLFVPNEEKYQFESEKLTPEENRAAIPNRPKYDDLPKYHHEIASPESIADLFLKFEFKDILLTSLAKDSPVLGDHSYKLISKNDSIPSKEVNLHFTATSCKWAEVFNDQIHSLSNLPEQDASLTYENKNLMEQIGTGIEKFKELTGDNDLSTLESFHKAFTYLRAFQNSERTVTGVSTQSDTTPLITFEAVSSYLLNSKDISENAENFDVFLGFIKKNIQLFTHENLKQFLVLLINNLHESKLSTIQMKLNSFAKFMEVIFEIYPSITSELNPIYLDKLSYLYTMTANIPKANEILSSLIQNYKLSPSKESINSFLAEYEKNLNSKGEVDLQTRKESIFRDLSSLKPVFFHKGLNSISFNLLLNNSVLNIIDLEKFLSLASLSAKGKSLLSKFSYEIIRKLQSIQSTTDESMNEKSLQLTQLIKSLIIDNNVKLTEEGLRLIEKLYSELEQTSNIKIIQALVADANA